jgi:hypothetical protein
MSDDSEPRERDPFQSRYDTEESTETSKSEETSKTTETSKTSETVRDRKNVNMYLPDELVEEMQIRYSELNAKWAREHGGDDLPKNQEYYPAVIRAALNETAIEDELGIEE